MNIFDMFKQLEQDDTKIFTNGYNTIYPGKDSYELIITNSKNEVIEVLMSNWREA